MGRILASSILCALVASCARAPQPEATRAPIFYPLPPDLPRIQYLTSIASPRDLPRARRGFQDFVLGEDDSPISLVKPYGVAMSGAQMYVCDTILNQVLVLDFARGTIRPLSSGVGSDALANPINITIAEDGTKYVADPRREAVLVYGADDHFVGVLGTTGESKPGDVAIAGDRLIVADTDNHEVEIWDRASGQITGLLGGQGHELGQFLDPTNLALAADGSVWVSDTSNFRIQHLTAEGSPLGAYGDVGTSLGNFSRPKGIAVDPEGRVYVVDAGFSNVQVFDSEGQLLMFFGGQGPDRSNLDLPADVAVVTDPESIALFAPQVAPGQSVEYLILVSSQFGEGRINVYGFLGPPDEATEAAAAP